MALRKLLIRNKLDVKTKALKDLRDKLVDCLEKCLICRHIRRFAD